MNDCGRAGASSRHAARGTVKAGARRHASGVDEDRDKGRDEEWNTETWGMVDGEKKSGRDFHPRPLLCFREGVVTAAF